MVIYVSELVLNVSEHAFFDKKNTKENIKIFITFKAQPNLHFYSIVTAGNLEKKRKRLRWNQNVNKLCSCYQIWYPQYDRSGNYYSIQNLLHRALAIATEKCSQCLALNTYEYRLSTLRS